MRVRIRPDRLHVYPAYRRVGHNFGPNWTDVVDGALSPDQLNFLTNASAHVLEIEGAPSKAAVEPGTPSEAVAAASRAGVSLPGHPTSAEAMRVTERDEETAEPSHRRRGR